MLCAGIARKNRKRIDKCSIINYHIGMANKITYAVWHRPLEEWVTNLKNEVLGFDNIHDADEFRKGIDVVGHPDMEVKVYDGALPVTFGRNK